MQPIKSTSLNYLSDIIDDTLYYNNKFHGLITLYSQEGTVVIKNIPYFLDSGASVNLCHAQVLQEFDMSIKRIIEDLNKNATLNGLEKEQKIEALKSESLSLFACKMPQPLGGYVGAASSQHCDVTLGIKLDIACRNKSETLEDNRVVTLEDKFTFFIDEGITTKVDSPVLVGAPIIFAANNLLAKTFGTNNAVRKRIDEEFKFQREHSMKEFLSKIPQAVPNSAIFKEIAPSASVNAIRSYSFQPLDKLFEQVGNLRQISFMQNLSLEDILRRLADAKQFTSGDEFANYLTINSISATPSAINSVNSVTTINSINVFSKSPSIIDNIIGNIKVGISRVKSLKTAISRLNPFKEKTVQLLKPIKDELAAQETILDSPPRLVSFVQRDTTGESETIDVGIRRFFDEFNFICDKSMNLYSLHLSVNEIVKPLILKFDKKLCVSTKVVETSKSIKLVFNREYFFTEILFQLLSDTKINIKTTACVPERSLSYLPLLSNISSAIKEKF